MTYKNIEMPYEVPCNKCAYCNTGETQYCTNPRIVNGPCEVPCNKCCYCRAGETQYCTNPIVCK